MTCLATIHYHVLEFHLENLFKHQIRHHNLHRLLFMIQNLIASVQRRIFQRMISESANLFRYHESSLSSFEM